MRVVFMGTPDFSVPTLQALIDSRHEVVGVFTQPDRPKGRGGKVQQSPVKELALKYSIPVYQPLKIRRDGVEDLRNLQPDVCVTAAFGQILSQEVLDIPTIGTINVHASLLPRHRGSAPIQWAILTGDQETGITTMFTDAGIDTGDMLLQVKTPILPEDDAASLTERLSVIGADLLIETLNQLEAGTCARTPQNQEVSTYDPMLKKEMGQLDLSQTTRECLLRVRAMRPWPCAYILFGNEVLKVWAAKASAADNNNAAPGTILCASPKTGLVIATGDGAMEITELQAPNSKRMDARSYLLGHPMQSGIQVSEVTL